MRWSRLPTLLPQTRTLSTDGEAGNRGVLLRLVQVVTILAFALSLLLVFLSLYPGDRSILLEVKTRGVRITFAGRQDTWRFKQAVLCTALPAPARNKTSGSGSCDLRRYSKAVTGPIALNWQPGTEITVRLTAEFGLVINLISQLGDIPANSRIIVSADAFHDSGALSFSGKLKIGAVMGNGQTNQLMSGRYEMRESGRLLQVLSPRSSSVVSSGVFTLGDEVSLRETNRAAVAHGHLSSQQFEKPGAIDLVVISELGDIHIAIKRFRLLDPIVLRPDWIDRVISNPIILALTVFLTLATNILFLWRSTWAEKQ